jgi:hypothetical protein
MTDWSVSHVCAQHSVAPFAPARDERPQDTTRMEGVHA